MVTTLGAQYFFLRKFEVFNSLARANSTCHPLIEDNGLIAPPSLAVLQSDRQVSNQTKNGIAKAHIPRILAGSNPSCPWSNRSRIPSAGTRFESYANKAFPLYMPRMTTQGQGLELVPPLQWM